MVKILIPLLIGLCVVFALAWFTWFTWEYLRKPRPTRKRKLKK